MTLAICFNCGDEKHGAFSPCSTCGTIPSGIDDKVISFELTEKYHTQEELMSISSFVRKNAAPPPITAEKKHQIINDINQSDSNAFTAEEKHELQPQTVTHYSFADGSSGWQTGDGPIDRIPRERTSPPPPSALHQAIRDENILEVKSLIQNGADVNQDYSDSNPLDEAMYLDGPKGAEITGILLENGAEAGYITNANGGALTSMICFAKDDSGNYNIETIRALLDSGSCYIDQQDPDGLSPLMHAYKEGAEEIANLLIEKGASLNLRNNKGLTATEYAKASAKEKKTDSQPPITISENSNAELEIKNKKSLFTSLKRLFLPHEMKSAMDVLDEAELRFRSLGNAFSHVRQPIEAGIKKQPRAITKQIKDSGKHPRIWVYSMICNISGDYAESGQYHIYRGVLKPFGEKFLKIHDESMDELVKLKEITQEVATEQKSKLREGIASVG